MKRAAGVWVITGAASGLGREFARQLGSRGVPLALWDRNRQGLEETATLLETPYALFEVDVTDPKSVAQAAEATAAEFGPVANLVHCAGVLRVGEAASMPFEDYAAMMQVNYLGSVAVVQALLPQLHRAPGQSTVLLIASIAALRGLPGLAGYCASKFAVLGFAQALRDELAGTKVNVRVLCPPPVDTPMVRSLPTLPAIYKLSKTYTAEQIVGSALRRLDAKGPWLLLHDLSSRAMRRANQLLPAVLDQVVRRVV